jgi:hypothetical protein
MPRSRNSQHVWGCPHAYRLRPSRKPVVNLTALNNATNNSFAFLKQHARVEGPATEGYGLYGRGLVAEERIHTGSRIRIPLENILLVTDDPVESISIFGAFEGLNRDILVDIHSMLSNITHTGEQHQRIHQQHHGNLPAELQAFLIGDARWDARLCAWLLYIMRHKSDGGGLWTAFVSSLPPPEALTLLMCYRPMDQLLFQLPMCELSYARACPRSSNISAWQCCM